MNFINKLCLITTILVVMYKADSNSNNYFTKVNLPLNTQDTSYNNANLFDKATQPQLISRQFKFTEGPAADNIGNVFFTDQPNNVIWK